MNSVTIEAFIDELGAIEKGAGLSDVLKSVKTAPSQAAHKAKKLSVKALSHPHVQKALQYASDPNNVADFAHSLANLSRFTG